MVGGAGDGDGSFAEILSQQPHVRGALRQHQPLCVTVSARLPSTITCGSSSMQLLVVMLLALQVH